MNTIHHYFEKHGIEEKDVPKALVVYKTLGAGIKLGCFWLTYRYMPLSHMVKYYPLSNINRYLQKYILYKGY